MITVTAHDAFALALIARHPFNNRDLVKDLSLAALPLGKGLIGESIDNNPEIVDMVQKLQEWAKKERKPRKQV